MPTKDQFDELFRECYWVWTDSYKGSNTSGFIAFKAKNAKVKGVKVFSSDVKSTRYDECSDTHIFFPASGGCVDDILDGANCDGHYWACTLDVSAPDRAYYLDFKYKTVFYVMSIDRFVGFPIRPVRNK